MEEIKEFEGCAFAPQPERAEIEGNLKENLKKAIENYEKASYVLELLRSLSCKGYDGCDVSVEVNYRG